MASVQQLIVGSTKAFQVVDTTAATSVYVGTGNLVTDPNYQLDQAGNFWQVIVKNATVNPLTLSIWGVTTNGIQAAPDPAQSTIAQVIAAGDAITYLFAMYVPALLIEWTVGGGVGAGTLQFEVRCAATVDDPNLTQTADVATVA